MNAPSPGDHRAVSAQRVLRHAGRVPGRDRRRDDGGVRGDRRRRVDAADRRARPGHGPPHHVPRPLRRGVRGHASSATSTRSTTRCATSPPIACACTCAGATTRAPTTSTSTVEQDHRRDPARQAVDDPVRGRQPAPRPRVDRVARHARSPTTRCWRPGVIDTTDQLHRAPRAGRAAPASSSPTSSAPIGSSPGPTAASAPGPGFGAIDPDICWAKLRTLAEGARIAAGRAG